MTERLHYGIKDNYIILKWYQDGDKSKFIKYFAASMKLDMIHHPTGQKG